MRMHKIAGSGMVHSIIIDLDKITHITVMESEYAECGHGINKCLDDDEEPSNKGLGYYYHFGGEYIVITYQEHNNIMRRINE